MAGFPFHYNHHWQIGHASATCSHMKVRQKPRPSGKIAWEADLGSINGKRIQRYFNTRTEAEEWLRETKLALKMEGHNANILSKADRTLFASWRDRLAQAESTLEEACITFLTNREKLAPVEASIDQAVAFYLAHHRPIKKAPDLVELGQLYIDELKRLRRSPRYIHLVRGNLSRLVEFLLPKGVTEISREDIEEWVTAGNLAPGTQGNRLVTARAFLEWARSEKYISLSPLDGKDNRIRLPEAQTGEVLSYSLKDVQAILKVALFGSYQGFNRKTKTFEAVSYHPLLGYLSAALFCGVRPEEIQRTNVSRLNTAHRSLVVTSAASKTNRPRVIEISKVAAIWFRLWQRLCPGQNTLVPQGFARKWRALRAAAGVGSLHDGLRHTFASMHYAEHQNASQLKALMGHSQTEETLFRHYRAVQTLSGETITRKMASEFWKLTPSRVRDLQKKS